jgi:peptidoglycan-associated lipoprotein
MRLTRIHWTRLAALAGALLVACAAQPKKLQTSEDVTGAPAVATAPLPESPPAAAAKDTCNSDTDCTDGRVCTEGRCVAPPSACDLLRVAFAFDSAQLSDAAMQSLRESARCLEQRRTASLLVEGHCDERGTAEYNIALGARRAEAVKRYLAGLGVTAKIETVSFGKELPAVPGTGESAWAKNRRAELKAAGDTRSDGKVVPTRS